MRPGPVWARSRPAHSQVSYPGQGGGGMGGMNMGGGDHAGPGQDTAPIVKLRGGSP